MGAPQTRTVGGGSATPTADAFNQFLLQQLNSGQLGQQIGGMLSGANNPAQAFNPLTYQVPNYNTQVDMNNPQFAAMQQMLNQQQTQNVANLRERFTAGGGGARGSGASMAEAGYLAQAAPQNTLAMGQLADMIRMGQQRDLQLQQQDIANRMGVAFGQQQLGAQQQMNMINQLFGGLGRAQGLGTPQAQTVQTPSQSSQILGFLGQIAPYAAMMIPGLQGPAAAALAMNTAGSMIQNPGFQSQLPGFNPVYRP